MGGCESASVRASWFSPLAAGDQKLHTANLAVPWPNFVQAGRSNDLERGFGRQTGPGKIVSWRRRRRLRGKIGQAPQSRHFSVVKKMIITHNTEVKHAGERGRHAGSGPMAKYPSRISRLGSFQPAENTMAPGLRKCQRGHPNLYLYFSSGTCCYHLQYCTHKNTGWA